MDSNEIKKIFKDYNKIESRASVLAAYHAGIMDINNYYFDSLELQDDVILVLLTVSEYEGPNTSRWIHIKIQDLFDKEFEESLKINYNKKIAEKKTP